MAGGVVGGKIMGVGRHIPTKTIFSNPKKKVKCIGNKPSCYAFASYQLTIGKNYLVHGDNLLDPFAEGGNLPEYLIEDDNSKKVWLPQSLFEDIDKFRDQLLNQLINGSSTL